MQLSVVSEAGEHVSPPGVDVTVYEMIVVPLDVDAVHNTAALVSPGVAVGLPGMVGFPAGTTAGVDRGDGVLVPTPLCAVTVNV